MWFLRISRVSRCVARAFSPWSLRPCVLWPLLTLPLWVWSCSAPSFSRTGSGLRKDSAGDVAVTCRELTAQHCQEQASS